MPFGRRRMRRAGISEFVPITPRRASELAGVPQADRWLANHALAGLVKSYAEWSETIGVGAARDERRGKVIPRDMWRRIIAEDRLHEVWSTGSVRLDGSPHLGTPTVTLVGIGFNEDQVRRAARRNGGPVLFGPSVESVALDPEGLLRPAAEPEAGFQPASIPRPEPEDGRGAHVIARAERGQVPHEVNPNALVVSVAQAAQLLNVCASTVYNLVNRGELKLSKTGRRSGISRADIDRLLGLGLGVY